MLTAVSIRFLIMQKRSIDIARDIRQIGPPKTRETSQSTRLHLFIPRPCLMGSAGTRRSPCGAKLVALVVVLALAVAAFVGCARAQLSLQQIDSLTVLMSALNINITVRCRIGSSLVVRQISLAHTRHTHSVATRCHGMRPVRHHFWVAGCMLRL